MKRNKKMVDQVLSKCYSDGTLRIHTATTRLYEDLHTEAGVPIFNETEVRAMCHKYMQAVREEIDFVRSASKETAETRI